MAEWRSCSRTETLAAARAPRRNDLLAALGRHTSAKTMPALAHQFARLVSTFHRTISAARKTRVFRSLSVGHSFCRSNRADRSDRILVGRTEFRLRARDWRGLYGTPAGSSMRRARQRLGIVALVFLRTRFPVPLARCARSGRYSTSAQRRSLLRYPCNRRVTRITAAFTGSRSGCRKPPNPQHTGKWIENSYVGAGLTPGEARRIMGWWRQGH